MIGNKFGLAPFGGVKKDDFTNLVLNPNFLIYTGTQDNLVSDSFQNWTVSSDDADNGYVEATSDAYAGSNAVKMRRGTGTLPGIYSNDIVVSESTNYTLDFMTKADVDTIRIRYYLRDMSNSANIVSATLSSILSTTYERDTINFATPAGCLLLRIGFYTAVSDTGGYVYLDNVRCYPT